MICVTKKPLKTSLKISATVNFFCPFFDIPLSTLHKSWKKWSFQKRFHTFHRVFNISFTFPNRFQRSCLFLFCFAPPPQMLHTHLKLYFTRGQACNRGFCLFLTFQPSLLLLLFVLYLLYLYLYFFFPCGKERAAFFIMKDCGTKLSKSFILMNFYKTRRCFHEYRLQ